MIKNSHVTIEILFQFCLNQAGNNKVMKTMTQYYY